MGLIITKNDTEVYPDLLLGSGGRLGAMLRRHWPKRSGLAAQSRWKKDGILALNPLREPKRLKEVSAGRRTIICMSGVTPTRAVSIGDPYSLNTDLALAAIDAAPPEARVFVVSTAAVYGASDGPHFETDDLCPASNYGQSKIDMERAALACGGGRVSVLRIGNVAGADAILGGWRAGMAIDQLEDGRTPRRSYIGPKTLARVIQALCSEEQLPDILNIAVPGVIEMGALSDYAALEWEPRAPSRTVIEEVKLDTTELERFYKFSPVECSAAGMVAQCQI